MDMDRGDWRTDASQTHRQCIRNGDDRLRAYIFSISQYSSDTKIAQSEIHVSIYAFNSFVGVRSPNALDQFSIFVRSLFSSSHSFCVLFFHLFVFVCGRFRSVSFGVWLCVCMCCMHASEMRALAPIVTAAKWSQKSLKIESHGPWT